MNKRGQITIFVILGIMFAVAIYFIFLVDRKPTTQTRGQNLDNPESFIDDCISEEYEKSVDTIMSHGGFPNSLDNILYKGTEIAYLCKNENYYQPCVNQHPLYLKEVEQEILNEVSDKVSQCFSSLEQELLRKNYLIDAGSISLDVQVKPKITQFSVDRSFVISKGGDSRTYQHFDFFVSSPLYEMALIVQEIVSQEAKWCYFSNDGFMILYDEFDIRKDVLGDNTKIYTIEHKKTGKKMTFAIRGCVIPNGF
jgi:hypothetical protein